MNPNHIYEVDKIRPFILTEGPGMRSRDNILLAVTIGVTILSGTLLSKQDNATTGTYAAVAGNTGNFTASAVTVGARAMPGVYNLTFTGATTYDVEDPQGVKVGSGKTGVAFNKGGLQFTVTAGATPAVAGDSATITIAAGTGVYVPFAADGSTGPAAAILYRSVISPKETGTVKAVGYTRDCEVKFNELTGLAGTAQADLDARGIVVRGKTVMSINSPAL